MCLKRSTSMNRTATRPAIRLSRRMAPLRRSTSRARLGRSVSGSKRALRMSWLSYALRSDRSRTKRAKLGRPSSSTRTTETSAGKRRPSRVTTSISRRTLAPSGPAAPGSYVPESTWPSPLPSASPIRSARRRPITWSRNHPNMASAAGFESVTIPSASRPIKPSWDASTVNDRIRSARRRPLTSRRAEVMSAVVPVTRTGWPPSSCSARARVCTQRRAPWSSCQRYSSSSPSLVGFRPSYSAWATACRSA